MTCEYLCFSLVFWVLVTLCRCNDTSPASFKPLDPEPVASTVVGVAAPAPRLTATLSLLQHFPVWNLQKGADNLGSDDQPFQLQQVHRLPGIDGWKVSAYHPSSSTISAAPQKLCLKSWCIAGIWTSTNLEYVFTSWAITRTPCKNWKRDPSAKLFSKCHKIVTKSGNFNKFINCILYHTHLCLTKLRAKLTSIKVIFNPTLSYSPYIPSGRTHSQAE